MDEEARRMTRGPAAVRVRTGARLHFGPFALSGDSGRFGGIGLMTDDPGFDLVISRRSAEAPQEASEHQRPRDSLVHRTAEVLKTLQPWTQLAPDAVAVHWESVIPQHSGLGSGTQLALAVAAGGDFLSQLQTPLARLAERIGRGRRSAVGIHGFQYGGFIVDSGKACPESIGELGGRFLFPPDWPILLWIPYDGAGLSGSEECGAFARLPSMSSGTTHHLQTLLEDRLLPAIESRAWEEFSESLWAYGCTVGEHFSPVQGSVFSHPRAPAVVEWFRRQGIVGVAQSSWGPTIAAFLPDPQSAVDLRSRWPFPSGELTCTSARNHGAEIREAGPPECAEQGRFT